MEVKEASPVRREGALRGQTQEPRGDALRDTLRILDEETVKLQKAEEALEDLLALNEPNRALVQARHGNIQYQHKMIAKFQAEADELALAQARDRAPRQSAAVAVHVPDGGNRPDKRRAVSGASLSRGRDAAEPARAQGQAQAKLGEGVPRSIIAALKSLSVLENHRALLAELAELPALIVEDPAVMETPEHLRPRRLDRGVANAKTKGT